MFTHEDCKFAQHHWLVDIDVIVLDPHGAPIDDSSAPSVGLLMEVDGLNRPRPAAVRADLGNGACHPDGGAG